MSLLGLGNGIGIGGLLESLQQACLFLAYSFTLLVSLALVLWLLVVLLVVLHQHTIGLNCEITIQLLQLGVCNARF